MRRCEFLAALGGAATWPLVARAQIHNARHLPHRLQVQSSPSARANLFVPSCSAPFSNRAADFPIKPPVLKSGPLWDW